MMKLFALYIGGEHPSANIELHDMRFVVAPSISETHDELRKQWWGTPDSLHVDCWAELDHADGYDVELKPEPFPGKEKLYYVNLGGYDESDFLEKHKNVFVVARNLADAKARALHANRGWKQLHRDDLYEAEQAFCLADAGLEQRLHIHLAPSTLARNVAFTCKYTALKKRLPRGG
jgi:Domain of Unknown Function (DUF1543)